jgi:hypothetical protein
VIAKTTTKMEEKIQEIVNDCQAYVFHEQTKVTNLRNRIDFCRLHKFEEEERVALIKLEVVGQVVYQYSQTLKGLQDTLDAWNS